MDNLRILKTNFFDGCKAQNIVKDNVQASRLFGEIEVILGVNERFLSHLDKIVQTSTNHEREEKLSDLMLQYAQTFKLYTGYITGYNIMIENVVNETQKNQKFAQFLDEVKAKLKSEERRMVTLSSYQILPIQRIPRYKLLLEDLIKNSLQVSSFYDKLVRATTQITVIADYCNEKSREFEQTHKLIDLQQKLKLKKMNLLDKPHRRLLDEAIFQQTPVYNARLDKQNKLSKCDAYLMNDMILCIHKENKLGMKKKVVVMTWDSHQDVLVTPFTIKEKSGFNLKLIASASVAMGGNNVPKIVASTINLVHELQLVFDSDQLAQAWIKLLSSDCGAHESIALKS